MLTPETVVLGDKGSMLAIPLVIFFRKVLMEIRKSLLNWPTLLMNLDPEEFTRGLYGLNMKKAERENLVGALDGGDGTIGGLGGEGGGVGDGGAAGGRGRDQRVTAVMFHDEMKRGLKRAGSSDVTAVARLKIMQGKM